MRCRITASKFGWIAIANVSIILTITCYTQRNNSGVFMKNKKYLWCGVAALLLLSGCDFVRGSETLPDPVGIGRDNDDLKRSPCACLEVPQNYNGWQKQS
jgi:hypothetical protein